MARTKAVAPAGRRPLIAGNWKMNLNHLEAIAVVQKVAFSLSDELLTEIEVVVLPPFTDLRSVQTMVAGDRLLLGYGAQDLSPHDSGAYTGDISGAMLAKLGCQYVTIGHSERREHHGETDEIVNAKVLAARKHGITPILCLGEGLHVRKENGHVAHCTDQLRAALNGVKAESIVGTSDGESDTVPVDLVIAYEPVWAIGTGEVATPADAQEVCGFLRKTIGELYGADVANGIRILYGGSVKSSNVAGIMAEADVDGALVGGASLDPEEFARICRFREHVKA
ncbi:triose-phosphate isomerase [Fodinicola acaciae]|uniref:triose-phosphate isomerase n=1 Tax=Fodinicola acaciae TaxID=2681555 RepID=UPI0013D2C93F|nr:triose-phosphate isomerase [Fodinicola acaciae]